MYSKNAFQKNNSGSVCMTFDDYDRMVTIAEKIDACSMDINTRDKKLLFSEKDNFPHVEDLISHNVESQIEKYLPYLIYYAEVFESDDPEFQKSRDFINHILSDHLELFNEKEDIGKRSH